jgi:tetratricopeptide (TPR) repeat protein
MIKHFALGFASLLLVAGSGCVQQPPQHANTMGAIEGGDSTDGAIKNVKPNANTHFAAGQLAEAQGDLGDAMDQYKFAIRIDPNNTNAMFRLGVIYTGLRQYTTAIAMWKQYVKATNNSATGYSNLAFCEELAGRPEWAETDYQRGITKDPTNESCRINYGYMLARHHRMNEAYLQFAAVLPAAQAHYNLGTVYEAETRKEEAKAEYKKAAELDPDMTDAAQKLAMLSKSE